MADISVSTRAYSKLLLHAAKYPHRAVNGVLLAEKTKSKDSKSIKFVDAVPLFHLTLGLAPMLEVALTQIDAYCSNQNLVIAGYYQANEHLKDSKPNLIAERVADKLHEYHSDACLFMICNERLSFNLDHIEEVYQIYQFSDGKWKKRPQSKTVDESAIEISLSVVESKLYRDLIDFDNHLDDIMLDWRNCLINERLELAT